MAYHNIHTHIFTMNNAPEKFLSLYMPELAANAIDTITSTDQGSRTMEWLLNKLGGNAGKKYASFLHVGKRAGQMDVFRDLLEQYPDSSLKLTALTLYMEKLGADRSLSGFEGQIEEIINVKKRYAERLLVFFGLDPRWKASSTEILDTIKTYFENKIHVDSTQPDLYPFAGIKIYPSTGFYVFDEKLKPTLEWAADNQIPVMTHCSYLGGIFNNDRNYLNSSLRAWDPYAQKFHEAPKPSHKLENNLFKRIINTQKLNNNKNYSSYFLEPESYRAMLNYFKARGTPLKICFAHFGGSEHMRLQEKIEQGNTPKPGDYYGVNNTVNWCAQIQSLMTDFENVYTDVSYSLTDHETHNFIFKELKKPYGNRILFGTDFFMTEREAKEKDTYSFFKDRAVREQVGKTNAWQLMAEQNVENYLKGHYYP